MMTNESFASVSVYVVCSYLEQRLNDHRKEEDNWYKHFQVYFTLFKCFNLQWYTTVKATAGVQMRACVGLGACAWVSTFHCLILADCFCVVIWSLLEEGGRKQACSGLFFHGPPHKHFKIGSCFIYRSSHPHHTVMVTTFRG